jgi:hypothetical protein
MIFEQQVVWRGTTRRRRKRNKILKIFYLEKEVDRQDLKSKRNGNTWAEARRANNNTLKWKFQI